MNKLDAYKQAFREIKKEKGKERFLLHLVVFGLVSFMLIVVNMLYFPQDAYILYPLVGWAFGIIVHYLFAVKWIDAEIAELEAYVDARAFK